MLAIAIYTAEVKPIDYNKRGDAGVTCSSDNELR